MYAICFDDKDENATCYWTTRFHNTDNYTIERDDATLFASKSAARALMVTLALDDDHYIKEV